MKKKLLLNSICKIKLLPFIFSSSFKIYDLNKSNLIKKFSSRIKEKDFSLLKITNKIRGPILSIFKISNPIGEIKFNSILKVNSMVNLVFKLDKTKYIDFSEIILNNLDDIYLRTSRLFNLTKDNLIQRGLLYVDNTYYFNEDIFIRILHGIEFQYFDDYSNITDKAIILEIVKYFRSSI